MQLSPLLGTDLDVLRQTLTVEPGLTAVDVAHVEEAFVGRIFRAAVAADHEVSWYTNKFFGFYSKAGIGLTLRTEKDDQINYSESKMHVNYLLTLAGIELGSPQVRVFADFGLGEQGILCAGLRFKF